MTDRHTHTFQHTVYQDLCAYLCQRHCSDLLEVVVRHGELLLFSTSETIFIALINSKSKTV